MYNIKRLCSFKYPYEQSTEAEKIFSNAMREIVMHHRASTDGYAAWLDSQGFNAKTVETMEDWSKLPPLFANYFKKNLVISQSGSGALELTSSGTSGQKSRMRFDEHSIRSAQHMVARIFDYYEWNRPDQPCNYLLMNYEPAGNASLGTAFTSNFLSSFAPVHSVAYALRYTGTGYEFDPFGVIETLKRYASEGLPVRILGFPSFMWFVLERMNSLSIPPLRLHEDSLAFFGGGWKTHADQEIPKYQLYKRMQEQLGLADERCRDSYGAVEHPVPYIECKNHHFHLPTYSRASIRCTRSFVQMEYGKSGFLHFLSPYITSAPAHSIVMGDLATLHPAKSCGCGLQTDWFHLLGRASKAAARNCALSASELIKDI
jgi:phenylacetate-coenzyme A ligase PaaK-like adenylate-forming protein